MGRVALVDTGLCNLGSIKRAVEECGGSPFVTNDPSDLKEATQIILPGVGAFPEAMATLRINGLADEMTEQVIGRHIPFLGICLGMQLLATRGLEGGETNGLGWIDGDVVRLKPEGNERVPHVGWNTVTEQKPSQLLSHVRGRDFYFVHSFVVQPRNPEEIIASTPFAGGFTSAVGRDAIFGVQFHPEKSQADGFRVLRNFLAV